MKVALSLCDGNRAIVAEITDGGRGFAGSHYQTASLESEPFESMSERAGLVGGSPEGYTRLTLFFWVSSTETEGAG